MASGRFAASLTRALVALMCVAYPLAMYGALTRYGVRWAALLSLGAAALLALRGAALPREQGGSEQAPSTQAPSTQPPSTQAPSTQPPSTQPPSTQAPSTQASARREWAGLLRAPLLVALLAGSALLLNERGPLLLLPVAINVALLATFASSLRGRGPSYIERFARLYEPQLSEAKVRHCRQFTVVWVGFFAVNGAIAAGLALWGALRWWAAYTSGISYVLMGALFALEFVVRRARFPRAGGDVLGGSEP